MLNVVEDEVHHHRHRHPHRVRSHRPTLVAEDRYIAPGDSSLPTPPVGAEERAQLLRVQLGLLERREVPPRGGSVTRTTFAVRSSPPCRGGAPSTTSSTTSPLPTCRSPTGPGGSLQPPRRRPEFWRPWATTPTSPADSWRPSSCGGGRSTSVTPSPCSTSAPCLRGGGRRGGRAAVPAGGRARPRGVTVRQSID